jgi:site-specific DNA-adenine methylase
MKPLIKYRGGKSNEIPNIEKHIPRYKGRYIEPFFGGGALYFHLEPKQAIINDINSKLIAFYKGIRNNYPILRTELDEIEKTYEANRRQFDALKQQTPNERVEDKAENFKNLDCKALLVIGRTPLTEKLYANMIIDEYAKNYSVNIRNRFKSVATHILVANYKTNHRTLFPGQLEYTASC